MALLLAGIVLFFGIHSVGIFSASWRDRMVARLGKALWQSIYAIVALVGLALLVVGYGRARETLPVLYVPPLLLRDLTVIGMAAVFPMLLAAYFPGRIRTALGHPMLTAVKLWATLHLLANGSLADLVLFGSFLVWAIALRISLKHRPARAAPSLPASRLNDVLVVVVGAGIYAAFMLGLHQWMTGVPVLR